MSPAPIGNSVSGTASPSTAPREFASAVFVSSNALSNASSRFSTECLWSYQAWITSSDTHGSTTAVRRVKLSANNVEEPSRLSNNSERSPFEKLSGFTQNPLR